MRRTSILVLPLVLILAACEAGIEKTKPAAANTVPQPEPSLALFTDTLQTLDVESPAAIERAITLFDRLAPHDSTGADSAAAALMRFVQEAATKKNDSLQRTPADYFWLSASNSAALTDSQKATQSNLHARRLKPVADGEGGVYFVPLYETILPTLKERTSASVDDYLNLKAKEDTMPVFLDAGLAVDITELVDRLVTAEKLTAYSLPKTFAAEAGRLHRFYTSALLFGSDNSPSTGYNTTMLNDNFRKGYDYLLAKYPSSNAAATVDVWMAVVASGDPKKIEAFRKTQP